MLSLPKFGDYEQINESFSDKVREILGYIKESELKPIPTITLPEQCECECCKGTGKATRDTCEECDGEGEVDAETDYNTYYGLECKSCDGDGFKLYRGGDQDCQDCQGSGKVFPKTYPIEVDGVNIDARLLKNILDSTDDIYVAGRPDKNMLLFKSGEAEGVLMAMSV